MAYQIIDSFRTKEIYNQRVAFQLPLNYGQPEGTKIQIVVNITQKYDEAIKNNTEGKVYLPSSPKLIAYLQGGPGFPCAVPTTNSGMTKVLLDKGYQIVYLDQRGTGLSTPLEVATFKSLVEETYGDFTVKSQLEFILNFRADSIVQDLESIRRELIPEQKLSLLGQSYGGFISFSYMSKYPDSLKEVLITGGVPPVGFKVDDVYQATYARTVERNVHYYTKYPQDRPKVVEICEYLLDNEVTLPNGGTLSVERFQQLGLRFGGAGGSDNIHEIVTKFAYDLHLFQHPTYQISSTIESQLGFDTNVIYALFQEAIYCEGNMTSNWSAQRLRVGLSVGNVRQVYFTGEMVYKSMFEDYAELRPFKQLAYALHEHTNWSSLYDVNVLKSITWEKLPIVAATYFHDQYVDFDLTRKVKQELFGNDNLKQYITSEYFHNGLRADPEKVLGALFSLLETGDVD
ncbi:Proline iminopeptidase [Spathaspora sp. JA1]|nr:Proline iminopeptidase [Spathaspora sp. JA1]